ncbi:oxygen-dependent coproporphyrinogen oxidase [Fluviicola sp.]|jgi:coproporphyrinogen III oxidase|uniref:oxygen-dependent coproporphyrinogen oxidase n=1 Tax=Fluviicola sp. TaxID=1917219 RepID=UPI00282273DE|nr:oxygen-dependent coproporphyrinogen oxidase [Fluviicola sp.]MDR0802470.1 oxygen-dependent coproporphyrinogen oxidase [Fluviicola sp.]
MNKEIIGQEFRALQLFICNELERVDGKAIFLEDLWERTEGGGGKTRTIRHGALIEKGGVAFSEVYGPVSEEMKVQLKLDGNQFYATGVSIVLHPNNPYVPIIHMNVRYFELDNGIYWFGGGIDLTPHYVVHDHAVIFHQKLKGICNKYDESFYLKFKDWADEYFYLPHRKETRGVGGIFFDHLNNHFQLNKKQLFRFCLDLGESFPFLYEEQAAFGRDKIVTEAEKQWMHYRRGRYAEFNLVFDRGTKFGLYSGGRTESILMSLPPMAEWEYNYTPEAGSPERQTLDYLREKHSYI